MEQSLSRSISRSLARSLNLPHAAGAAYGTWTKRYIDLLEFTPTGIDSINTEETAIKAAGYDDELWMWGDLRQSVQFQEDQPTIADVAFVRQPIWESVGVSTVGNALDDAVDVDARIGSLSGGAEVAATGIDCDGVDSFADVDISGLSVDHGTTSTMSIIFSVTIRRSQIDDNGAVPMLWCMQELNAANNTSYLRGFYSGGTNRIQFTGLTDGVNNLSATSQQIGTGSDVEVTLLLHIDTGTATIYNGNDAEDRTDTYSTTDLFEPDVMRLGALRTTSGGGSSNYLDGVFSKIQAFDGLTLSEAKTYYDDLFTA